MFGERKGGSGRWISRDYWRKVKVRSRIGFVCLREGGIGISYFIVGKRSSYGGFRCCWKRKCFFII